MSNNNNNIVENRSEIVFLYDAVDANPNGNPLSGANRPRIDPVTNEAIVTDVRLKRYLRDQFEADENDEGVYITSERGEYAKEREDLLKETFGVTTIEEIEDEDFEGFDRFLDNAIDARLFGATFSIQTDAGELIEALEKHLPDHLTGPVQFSPGKTLHPVEVNEEYNSLTSVIGTDDEKEQGGFDLDDHRIKYGLIGFHGLVDEHGAKDTNLKTEDVEQLDSVCWRSIKNQTITRSKVGQEPRLYLRVEYDTDGFHIGGLTHELDVVGDNEDARAYRTVKDVTLDATDLVSRLKSHEDRIQTVHMVADDALDVALNGETLEDGFVSAFEDRFESVNEIVVYDH
jgi:CRISPR-associated protein Csh2